MKPFNLEAAKSGANVMTRNGSKARIVCFDVKNDCPIISLVTDDNGREYIGTYLLNGSFLVGGETSILDLVMAPVKKEGWLNIYPGGQGTIWPIRDLATRNAGADIIACVKVEWEE